MKRTTSFHLMSSVLALGLAMMSGEASAWTWWIKCGATNAKWSGNVYSTSASAVGFPVGPWRDALQSVVSHWNSNPSNLAYGISYNDPSVGLGNGQSEVWWSSGFGAPAITNAWYNTSSCTLSEMDVRFDNTVAYTYSTSKTSLWPYGGGSRPFQTTAMHEFGHAGGLGHTATTYNIMGQDWTHIHANGASAIAYSGEDADSGLVAVYGPWVNSPEDVAIAHWRYIGSSGGYSTHARTRILNTSGVELTKVCAGCAEPVYNVSKGQQVQVEFTYENMGKTSPISANIGFYLSTNDTITTVDSLLGSTSASLARDTPFTFSSTITIPTWTTSGQTYWIGGMIDHTGLIAEGNESNNASYIGIKVN
jgi:hypothetical protein